MAVAFASPPSRCPFMSRFHFFILLIGSFVPVLRRLRVRGLGGFGESLLPTTDPTLSRRSFSTWPVSHLRMFRQVKRPLTNRAHFRRASLRSAASVRFASTSTLHHQQLLHAPKQLPAVWPPLRSRPAPAFLKSPQRIAPNSTTACQTLALAAPEKSFHRRRQNLNRQRQRHGSPNARRQSRQWARPSPRRTSA